jgi:hypothetical protein
LRQAAHAQHQERTYVFVRADDPVADDPVKVRIITKAEYLAIAGPVNFTP